MGIGDFNQLDVFDNKLGGASCIRGWQEFINWKIDSQLLDIPFLGSPYTWTSKSLLPFAIFERLDRGYMSSSWLLQFPFSIISNQSILCSNDSAIIYSNISHTVLMRRPYQLDYWCLNFTEVSTIIKNIWTPPLMGSSSLVLSPK